MSNSRKRVGLLFVHGIGEQKRFEHLTNSVQQFAELMRQVDKKTSVSLVDRTKDWKIPPGEPEPSSSAPISLSVTSVNCQTDFECHEVWWADLGSRSGIGDAILFWIWGLGQWCAPIYRELDAAQLRKDDRNEFNRPVPRIAKIPPSVAGSPSELRVRLELMLVAIAAISIGFTWGLAKKVLKSILDQAPSPTILVQYLGDVRTYEERAAPGDSAITDPGFPRRVGIRRRMVTEMVAMADRGFDEWYVVAHSLGTVVAYNGLTEIGHTLPNYLSERQWKALSYRYKSDVGCMLRDDVNAMMPARPKWLDAVDVINRPLLFGGLKGFLTYGSPLNKFAGLWPRVVATATDRLDNNKPFTDDCRWINLAAPADPVAGLLNCFPTSTGALFENAIPEVENIGTPWAPAYGLAHIQYFTGAERFVSNLAATQKRQVIEWLMGVRKGRLDNGNRTPLAILLEGYVAYVAIVAFLLIVTAMAVTMAGGLVSALLGGGVQAHFANPLAFAKSAFVTFLPMVAILLWVILLSGQWRWFRESSLNVKLAIGDAATDRARFGTFRNKDHWPNLIGMLAYQKGAAAGIMAGSLAFGLEIAAYLRHQDFSAPLIGIAMLSFLSSIVAQLFINRRVESLQRR